MEWKNRVAIVTGASSGIGLAVARAFVSRGARVALVARTEGKLAAAVAELGGANAVSFPLDVTDRAGLLALPARVIEKLGRLDLVVNNAGVNHRGPVSERSPGEIVAMVETNLVAPMLLTRAALPLLGAGGVIVNVASLAGKVPVPDDATYSATKSGVRAFASAVDLEMTEHGTGVRVCTVCPGPVDTPFFGDDLAAVPDLVFSQPMSTAEQVAAAVVRAIETGKQEISVPAISGTLATIGYLSPGFYAALRPLFEKRGARNKKRYLEQKRRSGCLPS
jgi:short-subunit dehydrogenase